VVNWSRKLRASLQSPSNNCGRLPIIRSSGFAAGVFPPTGTAGAAGAGPPPPGPSGPPGPLGPPGPPDPLEPLGALCIVVCRLFAIC
jgi:hypothetical protein